VKSTEEIREALEVVKAIRVLSKYLAVEDSDIASRVVFFDDEAAKKIRAACQRHNEFIDLSRGDRLRALGFDVQETQAATVK
jgi:hypothetical protein